MKQDESLEELLELIPIPDSTGKSWDRESYAITYRRKESKLPADVFGKEMIFSRYDLRLGRSDFENSGLNNNFEYFVDLFEMYLLVKGLQVTVSKPKPTAIGDSFNLDLDSEEDLLESLKNKVKITIDYQKEQAMFDVQGDNTNYPILKNATLDFFELLQYVKQEASKQ